MKAAGEPDAVKVARPVRGGAEGKGAGNRHLASGLLYRAVILWEARQAAQQRPAPAPRTSYDDLYPACAGGCGDLVEKRGQRCYACASDQARRLDMAARRELATA